MIRLLSVPTVGLEMGLVLDVGEGGDFDPLVEPCERILLALVLETPPMVQDESVTASWIAERHPLPGTDFAHAQFGFELLVAFV